MQPTHPFFVRLGAILWWPFRRIRPEFSSALWVLYGGGYAVIAVLMQVLIRRTVLDLHWVGHFIAALGTGALLSSLLLAGEGVGRAWIRTTFFGLTSGLVFGVIAELQSGPPMDAIDLCFYTLMAGVLFPLVRWLALKGSADQRLSNP